MQITWSAEATLAAANLILLLAGGWVGLKIQEGVAGVRSEQAKIKEELVKNQNEARSDMEAKHAENKQAIAVHAASDEQQFRSIGESLKRIESKVDRRNLNGD